MKYYIILLLLVCGCCGCSYEKTNTASTLDDSTAGSNDQTLEEAGIMMREGGTMNAGQAGHDQAGHDQAGHDQAGHDQVIAGEDIIGGSENEEMQDRSDQLFDLNHMITVEIEMPEEEWNTLRTQTRDQLNLLRPECLGEPFDSPFTWFHADITVDGERFENVGIRKKGFFGSLSEVRPSLKIRLDKFIEDQEYLDVKRLTLNNSQQDPSFVRQCLAYEIFRQANVIAPRCHFAHIIINGVDYGIFNNIESVKKPFLRRNFEHIDGLLYEGTLSDFREGWQGSFEQKTQEDTPNSAPIEAISEALLLDDDQLMTALEDVINLEQYFSFWAVETMIAHWDGYAGNTNNFLIYEEQAGQGITFIPWGVDGTFGPPYQFFEQTLAPRSINASGYLAQRLYAHPEGRQRYLERLVSLLDELWDEEGLNQLIDSMQDTFIEGVASDERLETFLEADKVRAFVNEQEALIRAEIDSGPVEWDTPLRTLENLCGGDAGTFVADFETTWASWPTQDAFQTGSGEIDFTYYDDMISALAVGAAIGPDEDLEGITVLLIPIQVSEDLILFLRFAVPDSEIIDQNITTFELPNTAYQCDLFAFRPRYQRFNQFATCSAGSLNFTEFNTIDGESVQGSINVSLWGRK